MVGVREHVHRLHLHNAVLAVKHVKVACLRSRVTTHVHNTLWFCKKDGVNHILVHACARGIGDNHIWTTILRDKVLVENILYIASEE